MRLRPSRAQVVIFLVAVSAYLPGFWWGAPHATADDRRKAWGVDDEPPIGPLAQLHDMLTPGLSPDENLGYPMMHSYVILGAYAPYVAVLMATGKLSSPGSEYPYGFSDPVAALRHLSWIAHLVSVLLAAGIVLAAFELGSSMWGQREGWWAAVFGLLSYPMFYYARTSNVDVLMLFFAAWSLVVLARMLRFGVTNQRAAWFGALAGLAVATKEPIAALFVGVPVLLLVPHETWPGYRSPSAVARIMGLTAVAAFAAYALGSGMVLDFARWKGHLAFAVTRTADVGQGSVAFMAAYPRTFAGHWELFQLIGSKLRDTLTLPGGLLALAGIGIAFQRSRRSTWLLVPALTYLLVLFFIVRGAQLRYVMPAAFVLAVFAGYGVAQATRAARQAVRVPAVLTTAAAVVMALLWAADLTSAMIRDSRYAAGRWIAAAGRPGDRVEYFGAFQKNPPLPAWMESGLAIEYGGAAKDAPRDEATANRIRTGWSDRSPRFIILTPDHSSRPGEPYAHSCPPQIYADLEAGSLGYVRAATFQSAPLIPLVRRPVLDYGAVNPPVRIYVPAGDSAVLSMGR
jgi:4-amino-4-deoxy-L-arabinose transferase-like glycosyltransferase